MTTISSGVLLPVHGSFLRTFAIFNVRNYGVASCYVPPFIFKGSQAEQIVAKLPVVPQQSSLKLMGRSLYGPGRPYAKEAS